MKGLLRQLESALKTSVAKGEAAKRSSRSSSSSKRKPSPRVKSEYLEDEEEDLATAVQILSRETMRAMQSQIRKAGFKGALVHGGTHGPIVTYGGEQYRFRIVES